MNEFEVIFEQAHQKAWLPIYRRFVDENLLMPGETIYSGLQRLQAENEERRKAQPYVYIGKDGKSVLARDLEDRLLKAEAELSSLKACEGTDADTRPRYSMKRMRDEIAKAKAYARAEALEAGAKEAEAQNCHAVAAAIRRLKEGA